jgi:uncharacterized oligopeptide transporter (OPT) family protein
MSQESDPSMPPDIASTPDLPVPPGSGQPGQDASPEEKDLWWFKNVYQGDHVPQFTLRAVLVGGLIGIPMAASNLYTSIKLGWAFGVTITACVMAYSLSTLMKGLGMRPLTMLENNCMQSTASAAGYSTGGTVAAAFGALLLMTGQHTPWPILAAFVLLTALLGVFLAVPFKRQMVNHEQLAFPTGIAAAETTRSLYSEGASAKRKANILLLALAVGALVGALRMAADTCKSFGWTDVAANLGAMFPTEFNLPHEWIPVLGGTTLLHGFVFETSVLLIAAGVITGFRVGFSMLLSSALLYFVLTPILFRHDQTLAEGVTKSLTLGLDAETGLNKTNPTRWGLWTGTALLVFASLTGIALQWKTVARAFTGARGGGKGAAEMARIEVPGSWMIIGMVPVSIALVALLYISFHISIPLGILSVFMSFVVALVCCRSTGETDTTPIGAMGKVTQLLYAGLPGARGVASVNLMAAGATSSAGTAAADLLTDLKSGYLLGANPRKQFLAQFCGIFVGTAAVVPIWYMLAPNAKTFEKYNPYAANMWKAMAEVLSGGLDTLPKTALWSACAGALIGILLPVLEKVMPKHRHLLPSAMGLGLGFVVPFQNAISFFLGGVIAWWWSKKRPLSAGEYMIAIAAGLIAGEGLISAVSAIIQTAVGLTQGAS